MILEFSGTCFKSSTPACLLNQRHPFGVVGFDFGFLRRSLSVKCTVWPDEIAVASFLREKRTKDENRIDTTY